jgi:shikimate kinase
MSIILIGYRGSGKTSAGRTLARRLGWDFVDTDQVIVEKSGMTIREIFTRDGEPGFRALETQAIRSVIRREKTVIALGGGAVLRLPNRRLIKNSGHPVVYLSADPSTLFSRINGDTGTATNRPALTNLGGTIDEVRQVLESRLPLYREVATLQIGVDQLSVDQVVDQIAATLKND